MSTTSLTDADRLVNRLKNSDPATFEKYVRSRITQIVNLEVLEDFLPSDNKKVTAKAVDWLKERKKERMKKRIGKCTLDGAVTGSALTPILIKKLRILIDFLNQPKCLCEEGLFRKSGNLQRQKKLEEAFNYSAAKLECQLQEEILSPHDVASLLKLFLRELPEPLLTNKPLRVYNQLADYFHSPLKMLECIQLLLQLLPRDNHILLKLLLELLHNTSMMPASKMTAKTLGTLFAPHVLSCRPMDAESLRVQAESGNTALVMAFMIENSNKLFKAPQLLVQSIENHWRNLELGFSDEDIPNEENTSDMHDRPLEMNTRFTFTQREVDEANDFQAMEIAKLQAVIASMPNSSKQKKKYIKRIVQQTPANYYGTNNEKHKRSRSVSSTLKKLVSKNTIHNRRSPRHSSHSPPSHNTRKFISNQSNCSPEIHYPSHCNITSPTWMPVAKLFLDAHDYTNTCDETPTKKIAHDPSRVVVVQHLKRKNSTQTDKAKTIMLKSPMKSKICPRAAKATGLYSPRMDSTNIISRRQDFESGLPLHHPRRLPRNSPSHSTTVKSTVLKRQVPISHSISKSPSFSSIHGTPTRSTVPESFRIAMTSPITQACDKSPLTKSLEYAPRSVKKAVRTPRARTPMAAL